MSEVSTRKIHQSLPGDKRSKLESPGSGRQVLHTCTGPWEQRIMVTKSVGTEVKNNRDCCTSEQRDTSAKVHFPRHSSLARLLPTSCPFCSRRWSKRQHPSFPLSTHCSMIRYASCLVGGGIHCTNNLLRQNSSASLECPQLQQMQTLRLHPSARCYNWLLSKIREAYKGWAGASTGACAARVEQGSTARLETRCIKQVTNKREYSKAYLETRG